MDKFRCGLAILACLVCCLPLLGRGGLPTLLGTVTDPSGGIVPETEVIIEEQTTGIMARTLTTDTQGNYEVPALKEATYELRVEAKGFETYVRRDIHLGGNEARRVDVTLRVGAAASEVTMSGARRAEIGDLREAGPPRLAKIDSPPSPPARRRGAPASLLQGTFQAIQGNSGWLVLRVGS